MNSYGTVSTCNVPDLPTCAPQPGLAEISVKQGEQLDECNILARRILDVLNSETDQRVKNNEAPKNLIEAAIQNLESTDMLLDTLRRIQGAIGG